MSKATWLLALTPLFITCAGDNELQESWRTTTEVNQTRLCEAYTSHDDEWLALVHFDEDEDTPVDMDTLRALLEDEC